MEQKRVGVKLGLVLLLIVSFLFVVSCAKHRDTAGTTPGGEAAEAAEKARQEGAEAEGEAAISEEELAAQKRAQQEAERKRREAEREKMAREEFVNKNVYFGFDDSTLTRKARQILAEKADFLRSHPDVEVVIEGHCDERGTKEYNMALGQRRAQSIKNFLVNAGIDPDRLETVSYGEERPADPRSNEAAWAKNRRGHFRIQ
jgi:peptidoglycan-associated lipoprotein